MVGDMPLSPEQSSQKGPSPVIWPFITLFLSINAVVFTHMGNKGGALVPEEWILCAFGIIVAGLVLIWPFWLRHLARMNPPAMHLEPAEKAEILAAMEKAKAEGAGATVYKGRLVDIASIRQAEVIVRQSEMIKG